MATKFGAHTLESAERLRCLAELRKAINGMRDYPVLEHAQHGDDRARLRGLAALLRVEADRCESIADDMERK